MHSALHSGRCNPPPQHLILNFQPTIFNYSLPPLPLPSLPSHQLRCILVHFVFYKLTGFPLGDGFQGDISIFLSGGGEGKNWACFYIFIFQSDG